MRVIVFGATGMIGQGVLRECLLDPEVESVLTVGRTATGQKRKGARGFAPPYREELRSFTRREGPRFARVPQKHPKLRELVHADLFDYSAIDKVISPASMPASTAWVSPPPA